MAAVPVYTATADAFAAAAGNNPIAQIGPAVAQGLALIHVLIRCPAYQVKMRKVTVTTTGADGAATEVSREQSTTPNWKWKFHPLFFQMDASTKAVEAVRDFYSVPDVYTGARLISLTKAGECLQKLEEERQKRLALAHEIREKWHVEVLPAIRAKQAKNWHQLEPHLYGRYKDMPDCYDLKAVMLPLTPLSSDDLDLTSLSEADRIKVVQSQEQMLQQMYKDRFQTLFDSVFGEVHNLCLDIMYGQVDAETGQRTKPVFSGSRKSQGMDKILGVLERVHNFSQFASPEVLKLVEQAHKLIAGTAVQNLNHNDGQNAAVAAIKAAMEPLSAALAALKTTHQAGAARVARSIDL